MEKANDFLASRIGQDALFIAQLVADGEAKAARIAELEKELEAAKAPPNKEAE